MLARKLAPLTREMHGGVWTHGGGRQLSSATVGIVGCGHVGKRVARLCRAFGARIVVHDVVRYDDFYRELDITAVDLNSLLNDSDFVTLHVPLDRSTRGMIGARELARMKPSAFLVNTARGGIVDEQALKKSLVDAQFRRHAARGRFVRGSGPGDGAGRHSEPGSPLNPCDQSPERDQPPIPNP
jgi:phosphoglycerate dehydrogenase-like enzyme